MSPHRGHHFVISSLHHFMQLSMGRLNAQIGTEVWREHLIKVIQEVTRTREFSGVETKEQKNKLK